MKHGSGHTDASYALLERAAQRGMMGLPLESTYWRARILAERATVIGFTAFPASYSRRLTKDHWQRVTSGRPPYSGPIIGQA